jgi:hypothetical protein
LVAYHIDKLIDLRLVDKTNMEYQLKAIVE